MGEPIITTYKAICIYIYYRFVVHFLIGLDFLFITFTFLLHLLLSWTSSSSISTHHNTTPRCNLSYFYTPLIDKCTRVGKITETATLLDNIYTNVTPNANSIKSGVFKTDISDHYSIFVLLIL